MEIANSSQTTSKLYGRSSREITLDFVEEIVSCGNKIQTALIAFWGEDCNPCHSSTVREWCVYPIQNLCGELKAVFLDVICLEKEPSAGRSAFA